MLEILNVLELPKNLWYIAVSTTLSVRIVNLDIKFFRPFKIPALLNGLELRRRITDKLMFRGIARAITFSDIEEISKMSTILGIIAKANENLLLAEQAVLENLPAEGEGGDE